MTSFKFADLFSGIGGTRLAYEREGGECVFSCEIDEDAQEVYETNWDESITEHDVRDVDPEKIPPHDLLLACWPCPSFSKMGKLDGLEDERGMLFYYIVQIINKKQPKAFMLENVKNLRFVKDGTAYETVRDALEKCGYTVFDAVLNSLDFGLPQHRERLIVVGFRDDIAPDEDEFKLPEQGEDPLKTEAEQRAELADILVDDPDEKYSASEKVQSARLSAVDDVQNVPEPSIWHENRNGRVTPQPYCGTLRASSSWHYLLVNGRRNPTIRELLRLQGFPKWFEIDDSNRSRARRLIGNTVPIPVISSVATALLDAAGFTKNGREISVERESAASD